MNILQLIILCLASSSTPFGVRSGILLSKLVYTFDVLYITCFVFYSEFMTSDFMGIRNEYFMRAAALGTWTGDFITAWMASITRQSSQ